MNVYVSCRPKSRKKLPKDKKRSIVRSTRINSVQRFMQSENTTHE